MFKLCTNLRKKTLAAICFGAGALISLSCMSSFAASPTQPLKVNPQVAQANMPVLVPEAPDLKAGAYVLEDFQTGHIIASKNADKRMPPASLTKMMTLYVVSDALKHGRIHLNDKVRISKDAWQTGGSKMFVKVGQQVPVKDLLQGIIVQSGNDACVALSEYTAGSEDAFVSLMNQTAKSLGMSESNFTDSTGLNHPNHYSSARDMAILARALIRDFPEYYAWYKQKWFTFNGIKQPNRNRLLWRDPSVDGVKTGHTSKAGFCLVSSAKRNGMRLISVMMDAKTDAERASDSQSLLTYGFRFFQTPKIYGANEKIQTQRVWLGQNKTVDFGVTTDAYVTIPRGEFSRLKTTVDLPKTLKAPIVKGQTYGKVTLSLVGKNLASFDLVALSDDPEGGLWSQLKDRISMSLHHFMHSDKQEA